MINRSTLRLLSSSSITLELRKNDNKTAQRPPAASHHSPTTRPPNPHNDNGVPGAVAHTAIAHAEPSGDADPAAAAALHLHAACAAVGRQHVHDAHIVAVRHVQEHQGHAQPRSLEPQREVAADVEVDEAGKLAAFRDRFGHSWDMSAAGAGAGATATATDAGSTKDGQEGSGDSLADLIAGYAVGVKELPMSSHVKKEKKK